MAFVMKDDCVLCKVENKICVWFEKNCKALTIWQRKHGILLLVSRAYNYEFGQPHYSGDF
jgi:hypothetical protein